MTTKNLRPEMVYIDINKLRLNPNNPRKNDEAVPSVMMSISKYGFKAPLVCNTDYVVYCGNTRLKAARKLGLKEVPCIVADDLTPEEIREYAIVDNKTAEIAEWEEDILNAELEELEGLKEFGFDFELSSHPTKNTINDETITEDDAPVTDEENPPVSQMGDVWVLGKHRLICGDSLDSSVINKLMDGGKVDLLLTDPPYNVDYQGKTKDAMTIANDNQGADEFQEFLGKAFKLCYDVMKDGAAFYVWFASRNHIAFETALIEAKLPVREELIWVKNSLVLGRQDYQWRHEPCLYGWKEGKAHNWYNDRSQTTVMEYTKQVQNKEHPTIKPVGLFTYLIKNSTKENENVLDVFAGSGTAVIACEQTGRKCYSVEIEPKYCDVIVKRYINLVGTHENVYVLRGSNKIYYKELI